MSSSDENDALKNWLLMNDVKNMEIDEIFKFDSAKNLALHSAAPWKKDPLYFKHVKISAVALLKMVMHACSGGTLEVMGNMIGATVGDTIVVLDSFALPVTGTETRVNAGDDAMQYQINYQGANQILGRGEVQCGWYHSHPGYGCWLSGIDVRTQDTQQQLGPYIAVVVDPVRTSKAGRVEIGAFRTYPEGFKPATEVGRSNHCIPVAKVEDWGSHADRYYSMDISYFKSSLDSKLLHLLWHEYWIRTLSSSPLLANKDYNIGHIRGMAESFEGVDTSYLSDTKHSKLHSEKTETALSRSAEESARISAEEMHNLIAMSMKRSLFDSMASSGDATTTDKSFTSTVSLAQKIEMKQQKP